jgi:hypothetical protein
MDAEYKYTMVLRTFVAYIMVQTSCTKLEAIDLVARLVTAAETVGKR